MEDRAKQNRAWRLWTDAVESCLREIYLAPAIIDYQAVNSQKGPGEPNLVPPGTGMCRGALSGRVRDAR